MNKDKAKSATEHIKCAVSILCSMEFNNKLEMGMIRNLVSELLIRMATVVMDYLAE